MRLTILEQTGRPERHRVLQTDGPVVLTPRRVVSLAAAGVSVLLVSGCRNPPARAFVTVESPSLAFTHVRVIDGMGGPSRDDQTVLVRGGKITAVGSAAGVHVPADAHVIDGRGRTLIPGLVGMHEHLFYETAGEQVYRAQAAFARLYLAAGVTTIRTAGAADFMGDLQLKRDIDAGRLPGPDIDLTSGYLSAASGAPNPDVLRRQVDTYANRGATSFKAYTSVRASELKAAIDEAHARGARITGHLCAVGFEEAIKLGIDNLEHGIMVDTDLEPGKQPDVCPEDLANVTRLSETDIATDPAIHELIGDLVDHGVAVTSTLAIFESFTDQPGTADPRVELMLAPRLHASYETARATYMDPARPGPRIWAAALWREMQFEHAFVKAGGALMAGVDPTGWGGVLAGFGDQRELELLVMAGFTPEEAIKIASYNGAEFEYATDRIGSIQDGRVADLVLVRGNPSKRMSDVRNVEMVFKDGVGYDPDALIAATRGTVGQYDFSPMLRFPINVVVLVLLALTGVLIDRILTRRAARRRATVQPASAAAAP